MKTKMIVLGCLLAGASTFGQTTYIKESSGFDASRHYEVIDLLASPSSDPGYFNSSLFSKQNNPDTEGSYFQRFDVNGNELWSSRVNAFFVNNTTWLSNNVYVASDQRGKLLAMNANGTVAWRKEIGDVSEINWVGGAEIEKLSICADGNLLALGNFKNKAIYYFSGVLNGTYIMKFDKNNGNVLDAKILNIHWAPWWTQPNITALERIPGGHLFVARYQENPGFGPFFNYLVRMDDNLNVLYARKITDEQEGQEIFYTSLTLDNFNKIIMVGGLEGDEESRGVITILNNVDNPLFAVESKIYRTDHTSSGTYLSEDLLFTDVEFRADQEGNEIKVVGRSEYSGNDEVTNVFMTLDVNANPSQTRMIPAGFFNNGGLPKLIGQYNGSDDFVVTTDLATTSSSKSKIYRMRTDEFGSMCFDLLIGTQVDELGIEIESFEHDFEGLEIVMEDEDGTFTNAPEQLLPICQNTKTPILASVQEENQSEFEIFPNPAMDVVNIKIENPEAASIDIYDASGRRVQFLRMDNAQGIKIVGLSSGAYIVNISTKTDTHQKKVIVQ